jgi:hypothetical protein
MTSHSPITVQAIDSFVEELEADNDGIGHFFVSYDEENEDLHPNIRIQTSNRSLQPHLPLFLSHFSFFICTFRRMMELLHGSFSLVKAILESNALPRTKRNIGKKIYSIQPESALTRVLHTGAIMIMIWL